MDEIDPTSESDPEAFLRKLCIACCWAVLSHGAAQVFLVLLVPDTGIVYDLLIHLNGAIVMMWVVFGLTSHLVICTKFPRVAG